MNSTNEVMKEIDYAKTPYILVYVMLPLDVVNVECELRDEVKLKWWMKTLKDIRVDGVMVDCWWGIVEGHEPENYEWKGYRRLFQIVRELNLKLQVVMSFRTCGGNVGDDVYIPLPQWVGNPEYLTWGIDNESVLRGRTATEVYSDYMKSFREYFNEFFNDGTISEIEIGLGPCGELRYPSYPENHGWKYPGIGEFQCFDKYLKKSLRIAAEGKGLSINEITPKDVGSYNSYPYDTGYFCNGGEYCNGGFFLGWNSQMLVDHGDFVLPLAKLAFEGTSIAAKIAGIHWHYTKHIEVTAGYYNTNNQDGYASIASMLKKHGATLNFTCVEMYALKQQEDALSDPEGLVWQVTNAGWAAGISVAAENALPCYGRDCYNKILENTKPRNDSKGRHLSAFTYLRLSHVLKEEGSNLYEFVRFVKRMHGEVVDDLQV